MGVKASMRRQTVCGKIGGGRAESNLSRTHSLCKGPEAGASLYLRE